ncbi:hypothetical protein PFUGPA_05229 [Plasmodium falciparum Palo Alto/Uganda]|uniref:Uncharacterized protein n=7 Tax=Plasmodium falciparum TaxID=5833 RepID=W7K599_PLAFO|nr:hypothetical protein PFNF135_03559 [Plasmodium falciparum NF135/5.C10]ETW48635.1 hypothetical protein PFMALIP_03349 [Plasmodium falciparum MaliPS096_E11]ETW52922.1 hypothetical protein PFUGPA_05229 [Plasmodium falciparum Palo Alto/Uganda]ETW60651.1 hypothetical protein PFMC_03351 [Plasmodium falciparum CAMP/Malaysia]EUR70239.1 hypothetical protein PFBG_03466 [Plasmodium falciparum 7G8]EWC88030.1 hypothetical protein PFNF54_03260 [Plasmodium falciparum NF54]
MCLINLYKKIKDKHMQRIKMFYFIYTITAIIFATYQLYNLQIDKRKQNNNIQNNSQHELLQDAFSFLNDLKLPKKEDILKYLSLS